jgi:hypothetical protein
LAASDLLIARAPVAMAATTQAAVITLPNMDFS